MEKFHVRHLTNNKYIRTMGTTTNKQNSMDEIVFENRNKSYGAYAIRKSYDDALVRSFGMAIFALLALIGVYRLLPDSKIVVPPVITSLTGTLVDIRPIVDPPPVQRHHVDPPQRVPDEHAATVFVDSTITPKPVETKVDPNPSTGTPNTGTPETGNPGGEGSHPGLPEPKVEPISLPVLFADTMPEFPGGEAALMRYMQRNIRYTPMATEAHAHGKMVIRFVVDEQGNVNNIEVLKKVGYGLEDQASEVIRKMPRWKPGKVGNKAVKVWHVQPLTYEIQE